MESRNLCCLYADRGFFGSAASPVIPGGTVEIFPKQFGIITGAANPDAVPDLGNRKGRMEQTVQRLAQPVFGQIFHGCPG